MTRAGRYSRRRAPLAALVIVMAIGLTAGFVFEQTDLRGVIVSQPAGPPDQDERQPASRGEPADFRVAFETGIGHLRRGDAHSAVQAFETARRANPHAPEVYVNLGFAYLELDQPAASRTVFEQASAIAPGQVNAYFGLAEALEAMGDVEGAKGAMRTYLHLAPGEDPFRRRAMSALWEWESREAAAPVQSPDPGKAGPAAPVAASGSGIAVYDAPLQALDGAPANLASYRGKFLVLNVWATWCAPCRAELPSLDMLEDALDPVHFAVAGVSIDKERVFTREYLDDLGIGFTNYWDGEGRLTGEIFSTRAVPLTMVIDPQGEIILGYEGARDWNAPELVAALGNLARGGAPLAQRIAELQEELQ